MRGGINERGLKLNIIRRSGEKDHEDFEMTIAGRRFPRLMTGLALPDEDFNVDWTD